MSGSITAITNFPVQRFVERGYHVVLQSVRGRFGSEGQWVPFFNEAADGRATLDWIAQQPWFNGSLGLFGSSYVGYTQWAIAADAPAVRESHGAVDHDRQPAGFHVAGRSHAEAWTRPDVGRC